MPNVLVVQHEAHAPEAAEADFVIDPVLGRGFGARIALQTAVEDGCQGAAGCVVQEP